ncbi:hypothetical protein C6V83_04415 [Gordonia iterans]|uniref:Uncharacterized protein n=1 Tax=Gordonia iterans TaxID=1004901 RepID=A0A2S0KD74_9ACTN|nr:hypothetical protein C6V83_04415 [Gordonia iterans]
MLRVQFLHEQDTDLTRQIDALAAETDPVLPSKDFTRSIVEEELREFRRVISARFARSIIDGCLLDH